jgi:uroporphyrinogen-III decarboxylase
MTEKENWLLTIAGKDHPWVPEMRSATEWIRAGWTMPDPVTKKNFLGIEYTENEFGPISSHAHPVITDIRRWRDQLQFPDPDSFDWKGDAAKIDAAAPPDKGRMGSVSSPFFLLLINLMGWVEGLCAIAEEPELVAELHEEASNFWIKAAKKTIEYFKPDVLMISDDISNEKGPFVSQECFRTLYKPYYRKIIKVAEDAGLPVDFHNCGRNEYQLDECVDMGVRIVQIPRPYDDVKDWKKRMGRNAVLEGGWDWLGRGGNFNAGEEEVRAAVRECLDTWARNDPAFIFWDGDGIGQDPGMKQRLSWIRGEVARYGRTIYK